MSKLTQITILELRDKYGWDSGNIHRALKDIDVEIYQQTICAWFRGTPPKEENIKLLNEVIAFLGVEVIFPKK